MLEVDVEGARPEEPQIARLGEDLGELGGTGAVAQEASSGEITTRRLGSSPSDVVVTPSMMSGCS